MLQSHYRFILFIDAKYILGFFLPLVSILKSFCYGTCSLKYHGVPNIDLVVV